MLGFKRPEMKYCLYYWLFEPIRGKLKDDAARIPAFSITTNFRDVDYEFALFCHEDGSPEFARVRIPHLNTEKIPEDTLPLLQILKEHLISTLRLAYREDIQIFPMATWSFFDEGKEHKMGLEIEIYDPTQLDVNLVKSFFSASMRYREEIRLLVDGRDARLPLQYRFLSYYKIIEDKFKNAGRWDTKQLDKFLEAYRARFVEKGFNKKPASLIHELRDRCVHIRTGTKKEVFGVTQLNHKEAVRVAEMLPLLSDICKELINKKAAGALVIGDISLWHEKMQPNKALNPDAANSAAPVS